jgi:transketolase
MVNAKQLSDIANVMRRDVAVMTTAAGSGHPTSCFSCAEIMSVIFFNEMNYDVSDSGNANNDEFILSKGHAAPIFYSALYRAGAVKTRLESLRKLTSRLEGHPIPKSLPWVKIATGSLGQGLSAGVGMALAAKLQKRKFRTYVLLGDSEVAEGSNWEAFQLADYYKLNNLVAVIDVNRLGQRGETMFGHSVRNYKKIISSFGWKVIVVNGHNVKQLIKAFASARKSKSPICIIAKTLKGAGVSFLENKNGWHGKALDDRELGQALNELPHVHMPHVKIAKPGRVNYSSKKSSLKLTKYKYGEEVATRDAYGSALASLARSDSDVLALDSEVSNSTRSARVKEVSKRQFIETFIAEQNMIGMALGLSKKGFNVYASSFAAFLSRAHDQIRMAALSNPNFTVCGSHAGVSIGEDGASQMGLEDIAIFRGLPNSTVLYPSDAVSCEKLLALTRNVKGIKYIRTTRGKTPVVYLNEEKFVLGDFKILKQGRKDRAVLVGAGMTLHECLKAQEKLGNVAVVDLYCIKPFNSRKFISFVKKHGGKIVVAEDHYRAGGIGEMLAEELENSGIKIKHLFVDEVPHSGSSRELMKKYKIDSGAIVQSIKRLR